MTSHQMGGSAGVEPRTIQELAEQAQVHDAFVRRLFELGVLRSTGGTVEPSDVGRIKIVQAWDEAGLSAEWIADLVRSGALSISWLDSPVMRGTHRGDETFDELRADQGVSIELIQALYEAIGFAPPGAADRIREGDDLLVALVKEFLAVGAGDEPTLRLLRVYADSLRRIVKAEAELFEAQIEGPLRREGKSEAELMDLGTTFGGRVMAQLERAILDIYHRHREHTWIEHSINHAEMVLEQEGLFARIERPPAICFVDLTGYTRITEERGDEEAARLASSLAALVEDTSRRHGGRPIRWLGDGGMFHFKEPSPAVRAGLDIVETGPAAGLPPMHIGIHVGPVIFQDGDVYGRTVNLASRIASHAIAGQVLASAETARRAASPDLDFEPIGPVALKNVAEPVELFRAVRRAG